MPATGGRNAKCSSIRRVAFLVRSMQNDAYGRTGPTPMNQRCGRSFGSVLALAMLAGVGPWPASVCLSSAEPSATPPADRPVTEHDVRPILLLRCTVCHGLRRQEAELDLRSKAAMLKGGKSGPAIVPGKPEDSLILKKITAGEMPPRRRLVEVSIKVIESPEIDLLTRWIAQGAPETPADADATAGESEKKISDGDRRFWSFQPLRAAPKPAVKDVNRIRNPIDAFVLSKLEERGLSFSAEADRLTLVRRAYFDLIGLPSTPEEVDAFLADPDPLAYERLIERLLASPHYGERWARYWLDVAGYSDSEGVQHADPIRPYAWRYRDYVVRAFNSDKPYDRFLLEQIAGDELADYENGAVTGEIYDNLVATGFLRLVADGTTANITNFVPDRLEIIADEISVLSSAVMGLTLKCARCHDHKLEPIAQQDYYRLAAVFKGAYDEHDWLKPSTEDARGPFGPRLLPNVTPAERAAWEQQEKQIDDQVAPLKAAFAAKEQEFARKHLEERLSKLPEVLRDDLRQMLATPAEKRNEIQKYLASKLEATLRIDAAELKKIDPDFKKLAEEAEQKIKEMEAKRKPVPMIQALWDRGEPSPTYLLRRGNYLTPGRPVEPSVPAVLADGQHPFVLETPWPGAKKTGRRLAFARWLTRPDPGAPGLTARVMVNRIWRHHFDRGIVATLDNFGKSGQRPTHPELLDWLAVEFVRQGWSVKAVHRLIMTSNTSRQSSRVTSDVERFDPDNRLLSRMPLRRLEGEIIRDSLLAVAGRLDKTPFGPSDAVEARPDGTVTAAGTRRSIYVLQRRTQIPSLLEDFDLPPMNPNCIERPVSTVAPQALHLMNNATIHDWAAAFAQRVIAEVGSDSSRRIDRAYRIALGRPPTTEEHSFAATTLAKMTEKWTAHLAAPSGEHVPDPATIAQQASDRALVNLCHGLMNSAEFLIID
ncbi:MAG: DUF1553 domain-containing protein [Planctomycetes bacterium]|nr:DUF1553 domain-containing protein [Planctomycetota bacterium]